MMMKIHSLTTLFSMTVTIIMIGLLGGVVHGQTKITTTIRVAQPVVVDNSGTGPAYAIGFYFKDPTLPASTCAAEFEMIQKRCYPMYTAEVIADTSITKTIIQDISSSSKMSTTTTGGGSVRHLRVQDDEDSSRRLQNWCYGMCDNRPVQWLIIVGCRTECGLRRNMKELANDIDIHNNRELQTSVSSSKSSSSNAMFSRTHINIEKGDTSVSCIYSSINVTIPDSNSCRQTLLDMTYQVIPLVITV